MLRTSILSLAAASCLGACATDPYSNRASLESRTTTGVLAGAALGAAAGAAVGADPVTGAAAGMVVGGVIGTLVKGPVISGRQYYKDTRGYCYYVDPEGTPRYAPDIKC
jgi:heme A synthase